MKIGITCYPTHGGSGAVAIDQAITQFLVLMSHGLTRVSKFLKDRTVEDFNVLAERKGVIPNLIDTRIFRRDKERCHPLYEKSYQEVVNGGFEE